MDIGQPHDYLSGQTLHLSAIREKTPGELASGENIKGNVLIAASATVDASACIGPNVVIGEGCKIGAGVKCSNSTLMAGASISNFSYVDGSIIGWKSSIGKWCRVTSLTVIAEDV